MHKTRWKPSRIYKKERRILPFILCVLLSIELATFEPELATFEPELATFEPELATFKP